MAGRWSSLWDGCRQPPHAAYPQLRRPGPGLAAYLALLRPGVAVPRLLPGARWALTPPFHPYPLEKRAVCFLWPFPSPCGAQALPGSLPYGARTFLSAPLQPAHRDHRTLPPPAGKATDRERAGEASRAVKPEQLTRGTLGGEQQQWAVRQGEAAQQAEREPVGGRVAETEREVEVPPQLQHAVSQRRAALGDLVFERLVVLRQQARLAQRAVALAHRQRVERPLPPEPGHGGPPGRIAKFLAHRVIGAAAPVLPLVQCQRDHQGALLGGEAGERSVGGGEDVLPEERIQRAPRREPFAACAAGRIGQREARVAGVEGGDPRDARRLQTRHGIAPGPPQQVTLVPARTRRRARDV